MGSRIQHAAVHDPSMIARYNAHYAKLKAKSVSEYYNAFETRAGYWILLGRRKHCGYYEPGTHWPLPITRALERMEDKLADAINVPAGSRVLDAGCGDGLVALRLTKTRGWQVDCVDMVDRQIAKAKQLFKTNGLPEKAVRKMDFHDLNGIEDNTYDAVYAIETLMHGNPFEQVMSELYRVTKPGGIIVHHGYEGRSMFVQEPCKGWYELTAKLASWGGMPDGAYLYRGYWKDLTEKTGFADVEENEYTENIKPAVHLAYLLAIIPYHLISFFGMDEYFVNTLAVIFSWRSLELGLACYVQVKGRKPEGGRGAAEHGK